MRNAARCRSDNVYNIRTVGGLHNIRRTGSAMSRLINHNIIILGKNKGRERNRRK